MKTILSFLSVLGLPCCKTDSRKVAGTHTSTRTSGRLIIISTFVRPPQVTTVEVFNLDMNNDPIG
ncbi:hypothetical protein A2U01_0082295, partial [Trifolium medium]|nr:hypothetical protein [Trifolium medium]